MSFTYRLTVETPSEEELSNVLDLLATDAANLRALRSRLFPPKPFPVESDDMTRSWVAEWKVEPLTAKRCEAKWEATKVSIKSKNAKKRTPKKPTPKKRKAGA